MPSKVLKRRVEAGEEVKVDVPTSTSTNIAIGNKTRSACAPELEEGWASAQQVNDFRHPAFKPGGGGLLHWQASPVSMSVKLAYFKKCESV